MFRACTCTYYVYTSPLVAKGETAGAAPRARRCSCSEFLRFCRARASSELLIRWVPLGISVIALQRETQPSRRIQARVNPSKERERERERERENNEVDRIDRTRFRHTFEPVVVSNFCKFPPLKIALLRDTRGSLVKNLDFFFFFFEQGGILAVVSLRASCIHVIHATRTSEINFQLCV